MRLHSQDDLRQQLLPMLPNTLKTESKIKNFLNALYQNLQSILSLAGHNQYSPVHMGPDTETLKGEEGPQSKETEY